MLSDTTRALARCDTLRERMTRTRQHQYYVYILSNYSGTLYVGMTNDLERRLLEHRSKEVAGFTKKYNVTKLVYYEDTSDVRAAIEREKQIKSWRREKKLELIKSLNPEWQDLSLGWFE